MLVEISEQTLEKAREYVKLRDGMNDMSVDEFREFQLLACYIATGLVLDVELTEKAIKRSGK
jgi:hypothetical protein